MIHGARSAAASFRVAPASDRFDRIYSCRKTTPTLHRIRDLFTQ
jgi:hypothetical protein